MRRLSAFQMRHDFPCKDLHQKVLPLCISFPKIPLRRWEPMASAPPAASRHRSRKIVVVMGPTGCGKTKLSLDLASTFFPSSEIINSDKIQVYHGLNITTNKIPITDRRNVPHHLLGEFESSESHPVFTPSDFRSSASLLISQIHSRRNTPFIVGGSNSFIYALLADRFDPDFDVFGESDSDICRELRYSCCFIWVDVSPPVLNEYLVKRVEDMLDSGMFEELAEYFSGVESASPSQYGLKKAIGIPEFQKYFERIRFQGKARRDWTVHDDVAERQAYKEAVWAIKDNTCQLAKRQMEKILRLRDSACWDLKRVDATAALRAVMVGADRRRKAELWEREVVIPSVKIVNRFLME